MERERIAVAPVERPLGNRAQREATGTESVIVIEPTKGMASLQLGRLWEYRELLYFLVWRDIKVRYKQTVLGILWILLQPVLSMVIFSVIFGWLLKVPSGDVPYPIFAYAALLPWNYFATSLTQSSTRLVDNPNLVSKVYFPRLIMPMSGVLAGLVDLGIALVPLAGLMVLYGVMPTWRIVVLPALVVLAMLTALGFSFWLSALNVRFRDIRYLVPFVVQMWMYATPVVYGSSLLPERFRFLLNLNPMTGVVEGFRWALLGIQPSESPYGGVLFAVSVGVTLLVLASGAVYFRSMERTFADIM